MYTRTRSSQQECGGATENGNAVLRGREMFGRSVAQRWHAGCRKGKGGRGKEGLGLRLDLGMEGV